MRKVPILITARCGSSRLPDKHMLDLGGIPVIEHVVRRCEHFGFDPYVCVPDRDRGAFSEVTSCLNVFGGDEKNVEVRLIECANHYGLGVFHHIDGDDPFFDRDMVVESIRLFLGHNFSRVLPSIYSQSGTGLVGTSFNLKANKDATEEILPDPAHQVWPMRLTLDYPEDYHLIQTVNRIVGGCMAPRWAVDEAFQRNPDLHKVNWFRNAEWKERQRREKYSY